LTPRFLYSLLFGSWTPRTKGSKSPIETFFLLAHAFLFFALPHSTRLTSPSKYKTDLRQQHKNKSPPNKSISSTNFAVINLVALIPHDEDRCGDPMSFARSFTANPPDNYPSNHVSDTRNLKNMGTYSMASNVKQIFTPQANA
jgi:hypothetical protein